MTLAEAARLVPSVLRLPPAAGQPVSVGVIVLIVLGFAAFTGFGFYAALAWGAIGIGGPLLLLVAGVTVCAGGWIYNRRYRARRRSFLRQHPQAGADPALAALGAVWRDPNRPPPLAAVRAALGQQDLADGPRALILCYGDVDVPDAGAFQFEPEVISPTRAMWRQLIWLPPVLVFVAWWILHSSTGLPVPRITLNRVAIGFSYLLTAGIVTVLVWIWRAAIRARYFRFAPGMIQVFEYRLLRSRPTVRSYPVEAGSLFIIARLVSGVALMLVRGDQTDTIRLSSTRAGGQATKRLWQALLSTAPTPPLSDQELLG